MSDSTVQIAGLEKLTAALGELGDLSGDSYAPMRTALAQAGKLIEAQAKQNLSDNDSVGYGELRASVSSSEAIVSDTAITVAVGAGRGLKPYNYAQAVEYGTAPHTPPLRITEPGQPLYEWVKVKHMAGVYNLKTRARIGAKAQQVDENKRAARAVWASIRKRGTKARPFFFKAAEQQADAIGDLMNEAVDQIIDGVFRR